MAPATLARAQRFIFMKCKLLRILQFSRSLHGESKIPFVSNVAETNFLDFKNEASYKVIKDVVNRDFVVVEDFIKDVEENTLMQDIERSFRRVKYQYDHWDGAIVGYRETEKYNWSDESNCILERMRQFAFASNSDETLSSTHVLDLAEDGCIKPHVDSVKFCGAVIAGLSLLSSSVMRLKDERSGHEVDILLNKRSLYIMRDTVRYHFSHEVLSNDRSLWKGRQINKTRRVSLIMRKQPTSEK